MSRRRADHDFAEEIRSHIELEADRLRGEGVAEPDARPRAERAFGNVLAARERHYESGRWLFFDHLRRDLLQAARGLRRSPVVASVAALSLALGIGANVAVFSVVNALLLRPYAFPDLDRLVTVAELHAMAGQPAGVRPSDPGYPLAPADLLDLRRERRAFSDVAAWRSRDFTLTGAAGAERVAGRLVSPELFGLLGVGAAQGRTLLPEEAEPGRGAVVVISHGLWQRRLGGAADAVGRTLVLDGQSHTIVGVMPAWFRYPPGGVEVWAPLSLTEAEKAERTALRLAVVARLAPGVGLEQAREELAALAARLRAEHPRSNAGRSFRAVRLREQQAGLTAPFVALFQGAAVLVLLIACANVGSLLLARGVARRREMALRAALGAGRGRLARQLLTESGLLAALGLGPALGAAIVGVDAIRASVPADITQWVAGWSEIQLDARVLVFAVLVALVTALATGLSPALGASRLALTDVLRDGARASGRGRARSLIVVAQMALALVLLVGAALVVRGFSRLMKGYEGFDPTSVLTFSVRLPDSRYPAGRPTADFFVRLLDQLASSPGVESAAVVSHLPGDLGPIPGGEISVQGRHVPGDLDLPLVDYQTVSPDYFRVLRTPLRAGRVFGADDGSGSPPVAVVSASLARRLWPGESPLGRRVKPGRPDAPVPWRQVVGVVDDVTQYWFDREPRSTLYLPLAQAPRANAFVLARISTDAAAVIPTARARVAALDPDLPLEEVRTLRQVADDGMALLRLSSNLLVLLGLVAAALSALGVHGVMAQDVARRTSEIGVRLALGARPFEVRRLVLRRALGLAALALLIGIPAALAVSDLLAGALFGVVRPEPMSLAALGLALVTTALLSVWAPARRAAALDPAVVLRSD